MWSRRFLILNLLASDVTMLNRISKSFDWELFKNELVAVFPNGALGGELFKTAPDRLASGRLTRTLSFLLIESGSSQMPVG